MGTIDAFTRSLGSSKFPLFVAFATGIYASTFYVVGNITMLPALSILVVYLGLTVPLLVTVIASNIILHRFKRESWTPIVSTFISASYLLITLRNPILEAPAVAAFRANLDGILRILVHTLIVGVPATIITLVFRNNQSKLLIVLASMTVGAIALGYNTITQSIFTEIKVLRQDHAFAYQPNVYFIVADGYSSFAYMNSNDINVGSFIQYLKENEFRIYHDTFSNYQPTTSAMLSMLNMVHHYYEPAVRKSEVSRTARISVGGDNSLVRLLKRRGYNTQYIHQSAYLLLHGCSADYCFPKPDTLAGALTILDEVLPQFLFGLPRNIWELQSFETITEKVVNRLELHKDLNVPLFQYIHLFEPGHADNAVEGICSEKEQQESYSRRVIAVNEYLPSLIDIILEFDSSAVIAITGDHGPFILNNCQRKIDVTTLDEYRDRAGSLMTVRWPHNYDGRFDEQIKTNINLFCYILASLAENDASVINACVSDDVYVRGDSDILKVMSDGVILIPPEQYTVDDMQKLYIGDFSNR